VAIPDLKMQETYPWDKIGATHLFLTFSLSRLAKVNTG
jgi:hypothetical protein